jgi:hypothetical protein
MSTNKRLSQPGRRVERHKAAEEVLSLNSDSDSVSDHDSASGDDIVPMDSLDLNDNEDLMVIAIDFGTTYSCYLDLSFSTKLTETGTLASLGQHYTISSAIALTSSPSGRNAAMKKVKSQRNYFMSMARNSGDMPSPKMRYQLDGSSSFF